MGKPAARVTTSSFGNIFLSPILGLVSEVRAIKFAEDPELTINECLMPTFFANSDSNFSA